MGATADDNVNVLVVQLAILTNLIQNEIILPLERIEGEALVALAVRFGRTRLIDNMLIGPKES